jgi:hypothetical protein
VAKRETYEQNIGCPNCKREGRVEFSEFANPVHTRGVLDTRVEAVLAGDFSHAPGEFKCKCGARFPDTPQH